MVIAACLLACAVPAGSAQAATPPPIPYNGSVVAFYASNLSGRFGMLSNPNDEVAVSYGDGTVTLAWAPSNSTVYRGFYLNAAYDDESTWNADSFVPLVDGAFSLTLPDSYCGYAWPVAPEKTPERGGGSTSEQFYLAIPPHEASPPVEYVTVIFTDGLGGVLSEQSIVKGEDAVAPADPAHEGLVFRGWDRQFTAVGQDITVNALWASASGTSYLVTFVNGYGGTIIVQVVEDGAAASAPADPARDGFVFAGWAPADFSHVTADLTVTAQWTSVEQAAVNAAIAAIEALPADPKALLRDTGNAAVSSAASAYNALSDELKAQVPEVLRLRLAQCAIAVLPSDPYKVDASHRSPIRAAQAVVRSLPESLQVELDSNDPLRTVSSSRSYGRYLENAVWALDALRPVDNATTLGTGTYTGQVSSASSMGKSNSPRSIAFTVKGVTVKDGKLIATLEHGSNSSQSLRMGGIEYQNQQADPLQKSYFEVPISLNSTFHFSVKGKGATDDTDAIAYEMTVTADEASMQPDSPSAEPPGKSGSPSVPGSRGGSGSSGVNLNNMVNNGNSGKKPSASSDPKGEGAQVRDAVNARLKDSGARALRELDADGLEGRVVFGADEDLAPAVAGGAILLVSLGALGFTVRFQRRESGRS